MKKIAISTASLLCIVLAAIVVRMVAKDNEEMRSTPFDGIEHSFNAKIEYHLELNERFKYVESEIWSFTSFFQNIDISPVDVFFDEDWIFRITFNWNQPQRDKIVVLIGPTLLRIDEKVFSADSGMTHTKIIDAVKAKYDYYNYYNNSEYYGTENYFNAKIEYHLEPNERYKYVESEIQLLLSFFQNIDISPVDVFFDEDWIFRITFNWNQPQREKTVVLIGPTLLQFNNRVFSANNGITHTAIIDAFREKYTHYDYYSE